MYNYVNQTKHTKEGVFNEKLALKKLLTYMKSVYAISQKSKLDPFQEEIKDKLKVNPTTVNGAYNFFIKKYGTSTIGGYSNFVIHVKNNHLLPK